MTSKLFDPDQIPLKWILAGGLCGGLAEVIWVSGYAAVTPLAGLDVAREVTASVFGSQIGGVFAPAIGVLIHFLLALAIAGAFAALPWPRLRRFGSGGVIAGAVAILLAIWAANFFVVLPVINPGFVGLMPMAVTFVSKVLFGVALGAVLCFAPLTRRGPVTAQYVVALARL